jgi:hypothetical protein
MSAVARRTGWPATREAGLKAFSLGFNRAELMNFEAGEPQISIQRDKQPSARFKLRSTRLRQSWDAPDPIL